MSKVAVILSAYNGTTYIKEQINSILAGSYTDFTIFIRDDGSKDDTSQLLSDTYKDEPRVRLILGEENLGFGNSFSRTMKLALEDSDGYDYFAFCDQDDFWEKEKLMRAVKALNSMDESKPNLFAANYFICDEKLEINGTFCDGNPMEKVTFQNMFFEGVFPGFCIVINRKLAELAFAQTTAPDIFYHDKWVSLLAFANAGEIYYDRTPLAKYRRHEGAASSTNLGILAKIKWRINNVLNGNFCPRTKKMLCEFKKFYYSTCDDEIKKFLDIFTGEKTCRKFFYMKRLRRSVGGEFLMRMILLLGKL